MKIHVIDNVRNKNGGYDLVEYDIEKDYSATEGRHDDLCVVCTNKTYPECREWCPLNGYEAEKKKQKKQKA